MSAAEREAGQRSRDVRRAFEEFVVAHDVPVADIRLDGREASASLENVVGREDDIVAQAARVAALAVVPHPAAPARSSSDALPAVLVAPKREPATIGNRVAIAWNGSAESTTAVLSCMPWLVRAGSVRVLHADEYQRRGPQAHELLAYLRLHGVEADTAQFKPIDREVGAGLLAGVRAFDADLLCQGAYSHSRLRQLILGGVTRHVLEHAHLPVLMCR